MRLFCESVKRHMYPHNPPLRFIIVKKSIIYIKGTEKANPQATETPLEKAKVFLKKSFESLASDLYSQENPNSVS